MKVEGPIGPTYAVGYGKATRQAANRRAVERVWEALAGLEHGEVRVKVQDGRVVQVERTDKRRLKPTRQREGATKPQG